MYLAAAFAQRAVQSKHWSSQRQIFIDLQSPMSSAAAMFFGLATLRRIDIIDPLSSVIVLYI